jgi:DNA repair protein RadA/Sms
MKVDEPAVDLGLVASLASSFLDRPIDAGTVVFGEVGLTGEVRGISQMDIRIKEAARMGFKRCILPQTVSRAGSLEKKMEYVKVSNLKKLLEYLF